mmetsp:Transcript_8000/g.29251  ORF Transcript_8000/g.29251 Transcript_8000/m.29251 type:complete len:227 (-) Transcript_8000:2669-3349(-)
MPRHPERGRQRFALRFRADALVVGPALDAHFARRPRDSKHHAAKEFDRALSDAPVLRCDAVLDGRQEQIERRAAVGELLDEDSPGAERGVAHGFVRVRETAEDFRESFLEVRLERPPEREGKEAQKREVAFPDVRRGVMAPGENLREYRLEVLRAENRETLREPLRGAGAFRRRAVALKRLREPGHELGEVLLDAAHALHEARERRRRRRADFRDRIQQALLYVRE